MGELKIEYYEYMVRYYLHEKKFLDVAKSYLSIFNTKIIQDEESKWKPALTAHAVYLSLANFDNEQADMLHKLDKMEAKKMEKVPAFRQLVKIFIKQELVQWPLANEADPKAHPAFLDSPHEGGASRWELFRKRVVQKNIQVVSQYYDQINTSRLCELLQLNDKETEAELSELVNSKFVHAKI